MLFFMPTAVVLDFISYLIYYGFGYVEDFYTDLHAILLTRYPKGLYSALSRIDSLKVNDFIVSYGISYLYFTPKNIQSEIPLPQPSIELRKKLIRKIDNSLNSFELSKEKNIMSCPFCASSMQEYIIKSHNNEHNIIIDKCDKCYGIWFDKSEMSYIADLLLLTSKRIDYSKIKNLIPKKRLDCPRCKIELKKINSFNLPKEIDIFKCKTCRGEFLTTEDVYEYGKYKVSRR